jgi:hypothetical protein
MAAPTVSFWIPPPIPESDGGDDASGLVLLDRWCYIANFVNDTTAEGTTSTGLRIQVTFRAARPPLVSNFCVHCPGLDFPKAVPKVIATDADLVLLCVPVYPDAVGHGWDWDYFVYSLRARRLDLVPNPMPRYLTDSATVLLSREDGAWYAIAALVIRAPVYKGRVLIRWDFDLHLYKSCNSSEGWISKVVSVSDFVRDRLIPLPDTTEDRLYHETEKTIAIGGEDGTVAWVDLWRGIFFCDLLSKCPVLRDVPLPVPARGNWNQLLMELDPYNFRDVTVSRNRDSIKYIETESWSPRELNRAPASYSYTEWVRNKSGELRVFNDGWKATTWTMKIPVDFDSQPLDNCWHRHSEIDVKDVTFDASNVCPSNLLDMLCCSKTTQMLKELHMSCPIISMDDDTVYLLSTIKHLCAEGSASKFEVVLAIDVGKGVLRGLAQLDAQKTFILTDNIFSSEICRYLRKVTGNFCTLVGSICGFVCDCL